MGTESTAIHDLLSGFNRKAIPDDPDDDVLFAGSRRDEPRAPRPAAASPFAARQLFVEPAPPPVAAPQASGSGPQATVAPRLARGTDAPPSPAAMVAPIPAAPGAPTIQLQLPAPQLVVSLPQPFVRHPARAIEDLHHATVRTPKAAAWSGNRKLYAVPVGLFVVAVVLLGVYLAPGGSKRPASSAASVATASESKPAAAPIVTPIETPTAAPAATTTVTPIEPAAPAAVAAPIAAEPAVVAAAAPAAEPAAPAEPALPKDAVAPPTVVPESAFTAKYEPTVPTVNPAAPAAPVAAPVEHADAAADAAAAAPAKASVDVRKSKRELARERRAAKRAVKAAKARVATADKPEKAEKAVKRTEKADDAGESLNGNGALQITSGSPREVWVDGRNSKRMTPLRVLLKPGKHTVTLFDKDHGKAKSFDIEIKPNATTKVAK